MKKKERTEEQETYGNLAMSVGRLGSINNTCASGESGM